MNLIQIVVLVLIHISVIHVISLFLVVEINLCIAKLLLFPRIQKPYRHLVMSKGYTDAMKSEKFTSVNFKMADEGPVLAHDYGRVLGRG